jgi:hypothetical protein
LTPPGPASRRKCLAKWRQIRTILSVLRPATTPAIFTNHESITFSVFLRREPLRLWIENIDIGNLFAWRFTFPKIFIFFISFILQNRRNFCRDGSLSQSHLCPRKALPAPFKEQA